NALELFSLKKIARPTLFVPEVKRIDDMLKEFQSKKIHLAIVVDEFGGTAGIVTLEDVIEEIMAKFNPSVEVEEYYTKLSDDNYLFDASIPIETLEEIISTELRDKAEEESYDTLGGFILHALGDIPEVNSELEFKGFKFVIKEVKDKRIRKVLIQKLKN
ncbi:MAG: CBS domain-containing protein, partial [Ignavibacteria bacterium]|nr:CBS domain-containing protein [Ignavibacteria bacterium]